MRKLILAFAIGIALEATSSHANQKAFPDLNLNAKVTVSGLSSGGYMAGQFHIAYSDWVDAAGIIAAGPYLCAQGNLMTAMGNCLATTGENFSLDALNTMTAKLSDEGAIAGLGNLQQDRVWLLHGKLDNKVGASVNNALYKQYLGYVSEDNIHYENKRSFSHHFPTLDKGNDCKISTTPFLGNCMYDAAGEMLQFLHPGKTPKKAQEHGELVTVPLSTEQDMAQISLSNEAYLYVPEACRNDTCTLHISFHGCQQNSDLVGMAYVKDTGINQWADKLNLAVLYPQTTASVSNPLACWDWWGYTGENYATRSGKQLRVIADLAKRLIGKGGN